MANQKRAYIYALIAVVFWSTSASAFKISLRYLNVFSLLFYASVTSTVALFICLLSQKKLGLLKGLSAGDYRRSAGLALLNPFGYYIVIFKAYSILPAQEAQPLNFIWPITLVLLSIPLLKQKIAPKDILAVVISFLGVFVIATRGNILKFRLTDPLGVSLATGSSIIWALFWIYNVRDRRDEVVRLFLNFAFASVFMLVLMLVSGTAEANLAGLAGAAYIGLFEMGVVFLLWLKALKLSSTTAHIAGLIYLVPFLSLLVISLAVPEKIAASSIVGLVLIVGGIVVQKSRSCVG